MDEREHAPPQAPSSATGDDDPSRPLRRLPGRQVLVRTVRAVQPLLEAVDPSPFVLRRRLADVPVPPVALACVYRRRNAAMVARLLASAPDGAAVALWGLDGVDPGLADRTAGAGPGSRATLLNRLVAGLDAPDRHLVLVDDDVELVHGDLPLLLRAAASGLDLCQPAHVASSVVSWRFTRRRPLVMVRTTGFVEIGPLLVMSPEARRRLLPLPEDEGMSWGLEARWARARGDLRFGIVDAVGIRHVGRVGGDYALDEERVRREAVLADTGLTFAQQQVTTAVWRPWEPARPWTGDGPSRAAGPVAR